MIKQLTILTFTLTFCLTSCGQTNSSSRNQEQNKRNTLIDTSKIAILPFDTTQYWVFKDSKSTELTNDDLLKIETILNECINDYNLDQEKRFKEIIDKNMKNNLDKNNFIIELKRYKRQYIAAVNSKGEIEVWINCFCGAGNQNWKTNLILVEDGGNCYFSLKVNLTTGQFYELMVNGDA
jgi:hypothetical protein